MGNVNNIQSMKQTAKYALALIAFLAVYAGHVTPAMATLAQVAAPSQTLTFQPNPADLGDLDHHLVYSWRIDNISVNSPVSVTSATLTFSNIANWDSNPNMLFAWLLDTATHSGVATVQDVDANQAPVVDIVDAFLSPISLVSNSTAKIKLFQKSFTTTPTTYTFTFNAAQLATLSAYINNGHDVAFGFDPDCHFFNDGITFAMTLTPIPEMETAVPAAALIAAAVLLEMRRRRRALVTA